MREDTRNSTVMGLMAHLNSTPPSKIMFDMNAHKSDSKVKTCILL